MGLVKIQIVFKFVSQCWVCFSLTGSVDQHCERSEVRPKYLNQWTLGILNSANRKWKYFVAFQNLELKSTKTECDFPCLTLNIPKIYNLSVPLKTLSKISRVSTFSTSQHYNPIMARSLSCYHSSATIHLPSPSRSRHNIPSVSFQIRYHLYFKWHFKRLCVSLSLMRIRICAHSRSADATWVFIV